MTAVTGYFDEIGFFESICNSIKWEGDKLIVSFKKGIDVGGSEHPLADSFGFDEPCLVIFDGVVESKLRVSELVSKPNNFVDHHYENKELLEKKTDRKYKEFYMEGFMLAINTEGWFVWSIVAENVILDDLK